MSDDPMIDIGKIKLPGTPIEQLEFVSNLICNEMDRLRAKVSDRDATIAALTERVKGLEAEVHRLEHVCMVGGSYHDAQLSSALAEVTRLREQLGVAENVIAFYADEDNTIRECTAPGISLCANCDLCIRAKEYIASHRSPTPPDAGKEKNDATA